MNVVRVLVEWTHELATTNQTRTNACVETDMTVTDAKTTSTSASQIRVKMEVRAMTTLRDLHVIVPVDMKENFAS